MNKRGWLTIVLIFGGLFVSLVAFSIVVVTAFDGGSFFAGERIGVVEIDGPISSSKETLKDLRRFEENNSIAGIVVRINSPGGAVAPSQELYQALDEIKKAKPLVVSMGTTAASGGYYIACGAEKIYANRGTVTGSIGVITHLFNVEGFLEKLDVQVHTVKQGEYKDAGTPFRDFTPKQREYFGELLEDIHDQFIEAVRKSRGLERETVEKYADGRVFTGRQAKERGLVDAIGSFQDAVDFIKDEKELEDDVELQYPPEDDASFLMDAVRGFSKTVSDELKSKSAPLVEYRFVQP